MMFEKGLKLIEEANEAEKLYASCEIEIECPDAEQEAREDEAYQNYWEAIQRLAKYLMDTTAGIGAKAAREMATNKRNEMLALFSMAK